MSFPNLHRMSSTSESEIEALGDNKYTMDRFLHYPIKRWPKWTHVWNWRHCRLERLFLQGVCGSEGSFMCTYIDIYIYTYLIYICIYKYQICMGCGKQMGVCLPPSWDVTRNFMKTNFQHTFGWPLSYDPFLLECPWVAITLLQCFEMVTNLLFLVGQNLHRNISLKFTNIDFLRAPQLCFQTWSKFKHMSSLMDFSNLPRGETGCASTRDKYKHIPFSIYINMVL